MKKFLLVLAITFVSFSLLAKPYFSEYRGHGWIIYFRGEVTEATEADVKILQTKYLEAMHPINGYVNDEETIEERSYKWQLSKLGVTVTKIHDNPHVPSENTYPPEHPAQHNLSPPFYSGSPEPLGSPPPPGPVP